MLDSCGQIVLVAGPNPETKSESAARDRVQRCRLPGQQYGVVEGSDQHHRHQAGSLGDGAGSRQGNEGFESVVGHPVDHPEAGEAGGFRLLGPAEDEIGGAPRCGGGESNSNTHRSWFRVSPG
jgi:hypothetical protein